MWLHILNRRRPPLRHTPAVAVSYRRTIRVVIAAAVALAGIAGLDPTTMTCAQAQSPSCRSACLETYNQCRLMTKGSSSCDSHYRTCLQSCIPGK